MKTILGFFINAGNYAGVAANVGLLVGRLGFGLMLAFMHGMGKVPPAEGFVGGVASLGFPAPLLFAWAAGLAEFIGSLLVAIGLATRPAALTVAFTMAVAALMMHGADPLEKKELALVYLFFGLIYTFTGAGKFSVDHLISKKRS